MTARAINPTAIRTDLGAIFVSMELSRSKLFDLSADPGETTDIAAAQPEIVEELTEQWHRYAIEVGVVGPEVEQMPRRGSAFRPPPASQCQLP